MPGLAGANGAVGGVGDFNTDDALGAVSTVSAAEAVGAVTTVNALSSLEAVGVESAVTPRREDWGADPPSRTLIIGYGSPIRGDDAIGPLAAEALAAGPLPPGVRVLARHVLTAELALDLATADRVIFIDAEASGEPGAVTWQALAPNASAASSMAHFLDPRELLAWCQTLYQRAPAAWLVTAVGQSFDYAHCRLSPTAQGALPTLLDQVRALMAGSGEGPDGLPVIEPYKPNSFHRASMRLRETG